MTSSFSRRSSRSLGGSGFREHGEAPTDGVLHLFQTEEGLQRRTARASPRHQHDRLVGVYGVVGAVLQQL